MADNLEKLKLLLAELFQLDQAELDFGIYRIMNTKREEITRFLDRDLLPQVREVLGALEGESRAALKNELDKAREQARELGFEDPGEAPRVRELQARYDAKFDVEAAEEEVYSHLYNFFRRYYSQGDFISLRRYKEGVYAIPYEGEEVKLYWANHDQYYIKTSEYLRDYTFRLLSGNRVHFKLAEADTERDNNRPAGGNERRFVLAGETPIAEEEGELVIRFEYRPATVEDWPEDVREGKTKPPAQKDLNAAAVDRILNQTTGFDDWRHELWALRPTEKSPERTLLEKHLTDYTARNTFDYFIHKDLGGFLRRELDFYIKNEVIHLDDVENETAPRVEQYLSKIKAIRRIAHKIIDFLAQTEDFQKKLWLKKKFVVETQYCITLDRIFAIEDEEARDWLIGEIVENDAQREEWVRLFAIDEVKGDLATPGYSKPLKPEFLKAHPTLVVDTRHFDEGFKLRLLAAIPDLEEETDGMLIHSENFQALSLLLVRYREQIKCIYIDPPYNTEKDEFIYKDSYKRSSWLALLDSRVGLAWLLLSPDGLFYSSIDEHESGRLREIGEHHFSLSGFAAELVWNTQHSQQSGLFAPYHEYVQAYTKRPAKDVENFSGGEGEIIAGALKKPSRGNPPSEFTFPAGIRWEAADGTELKGRWGDVETVELVSGRMICEGGKTKCEVTLKAGWTQKRQMERFFAGERPVLDSKGQEVTGFFFSSTGKLKIVKKRSRITPNTILPPFGTVSAATADLRHMFGVEMFGRPKPVSMIKYLVGLPTTDGDEDIVLDFFAGSGTTGHAVINLNREDGGRRRFMLVEMGDYFDTVLVPRLKKVIFSPEWKDGKPKHMPTPEEIERSPRIMKILRLESYEDTLNNLELKRTEAQQSLLDQQDAFREDYMLRYMLDVESRGSASLLNLDCFEDPFNYKLNIATRTAGETKPTVVDLVETFNFLIGLRVKTIDDVRGVRVVTGLNPQGERVLILWRKTKELDNDALDAWFRKQGYNTKDQEYDVIYVNGDNNLENLRKADQTWKVRLIEEEFQHLMFDVQDV